MTKPKTKVCISCGTEKRAREFCSYRSVKPVIYDDKCKSCASDKLCIKCNERKSFVDFRCRDGRLYEASCIKCESVYNKINCKQRYLNDLRDKFIERYHNDKVFRAEQLEKSRAWEKANARRRRKYRSTKQQRERANKWARDKMKTDPAFRIRSYLSRDINANLKKSGGSKNRKSILNYLPYSMPELKQHIESQFEPWMNWSNWGRYNADSWNDNDSSTWTWQIDHIIPHSDLPYDSMEHENFKKCWNLSNLRPLNAKQNIIDGTTKVRHKFGHK